MGTHPIFESDFDCLTDWKNKENRITRVKLCRFRTMESQQQPSEEHDDQVRHVQFKSTLTLYTMPYYNRKTKNCPWEHFKEKDRVKIKRELDQFKRTEMMVHASSQNNTSYYYQTNESQYSYSAPPSQIPPRSTAYTRKPRTSSTLSIDDFF